MTVTEPTVEGTAQKPPVHTRALIIGTGFSGLGMGIALQRQGVPSKLMVFPDEGHWVLKPQNSQLWYKTFLDWVGTYVK